LQLSRQLVVCGAGSDLTTTMAKATQPADPTSGSLAGMRAVVTGASGGIGRQVAISFAAAGVEQIALHYAANLAAAEQTADAVARLGSKPILLQADLSIQSQCNRLVDDAFEQIVRPQIWVHAAGADVLTGDAADWSFDQKLRRLIDVDLLGSIRVGRRVAGRLADLATAAIDRDEGVPAASIILIGWDQASEGMEGDAGQMFGPIKAGVEALGKSLAQEYAPYIRVNTIAPGWIQTAWGEGVSGYWDARARAQALMNRWGTPQDIGAAAVFLAGPTSAFITGQTLAVNGGFNRRWSGADRGDQ
jgi:3-oxoacyl-[acyl-carrier protein] reductase